MDVNDECEVKHERERKEGRRVGLLDPCVLCFSDESRKTELLTDSSVGMRMDSRLRVETPRVASSELGFACNQEERRGRTRRRQVFVSESHSSGT